METYSASAAYARALAAEVASLGSRRVGLGSSLGGLALLHAHRLQPSSFDGLFLQSGSYFRPRFDKHESGFGRYARITRFVSSVLRSDGPEQPIPVALTCGTAEENLANNRELAAALDRQGYTSWLAEIRDAHNWTCWRDGFDPHLPALLEAVT